VALVATAVLVPVLVALVVLVNVLGGSDGSGGSKVADVSGPTTAAPREDLPVVTVPTPAVTPAADASCPGFLQTLPDTLVDDPSRRVSSASPYVRAWGDPAVVLVCGADRPAGFTVSVGLIQIDAVQWYVDTSDPKTVVWTAVDRPVYVQVRVPASEDSATVTEISGHLSATLPAQQPQPGG
jgi:Protein of unknown function (DUF3515)